MEFNKKIRGGIDTYNLRVQRVPLQRFFSTPSPPFPVHGLSTLASAMQATNEKRFMYLMHSGADINKLASEEAPFQTLLWYSVFAEKYTFTDILLRCGAKQTFNDQWSLLTYCIKECDKKLLECLVKNDIDVNEVDERGNIPLELAVRKNNVEIARVLLDHGAEFTIQTAFMEAILNDDLKMFELLTERGADINFESITGFTPFTKATRWGCVVFVEEMLKRGVDDVDKLNPDGYTPLIDCIKAARWYLVELLVKHGAKVQLADSHGNIPLVECLNAKYFPAIKLLVEAGAKWDNLHDRDGNSPLTLAVQTRNFNMLKFFLDQKANVNERDDNHKSPLAVTIETDNVRFAKLLTEHGADTSVDFDKMEEMANASDNWKRLVEEVVAENKMLE